MKLEKGMFIRFKNGTIDKLIKIEKKVNYYVLKYSNKSVLSGNGQDDAITKADYDIKKLIEVGNIVYIEEDDDYACEFFRDIYMIKNEDNLLHIIDLINKPNVRLLSILTHEQFENNCYKIGD